MLKIDLMFTIVIILIYEITVLMQVLTYILHGAHFWHVLSPHFPPSEVLCSSHWACGHDTDAYIFLMLMQMFSHNSFLGKGI